MIQNAQPLSGAFVSVSMTPNVVGVIQGRLRPVWFTHDGPGGPFLTVAAGGELPITCTHPLFQEVNATGESHQTGLNSIGRLGSGDLSLAGAVAKLFFFVPNWISPPSISVANLPVLPRGADV